MRAHKREEQPWLRYLILPFILILFGLFVSYAILAQQKRPAPLPSATVLSTPTPTPTSPEFVCPANGWANCMPILNETGKRNCSGKALEWYKLNCPDFKGLAR